MSPIRNNLLDMMRAKSGDEPLSYVELNELEKVPAGELRAFLISRLAERSEAKAVVPVPVVPGTPTPEEKCDG